MKISVLAGLCAGLLAQGTQAAVINKCVSAGMYALTFDDGPSSNTGTLLSILASRKVKATFHFTTQYLTDPNVQRTVRDVVSAGHLVGLRSENTWNLLSMSSDDITSSVKRVANVMAQFTGYTPVFIRLPYGAYDDRVVAAVEAAGMYITEQNLDSYDYTASSSSQIYGNIQLALNLQADGAGNFISVQHDAVQNTVDATPNIIDLVLTKKYNIVKLDACIGKANATPNTGVVGSSTRTGPTQTGSGGGSTGGSTGGTTGGSTAGSGTTSGADTNFAVGLAFTQIVLGLIGYSLFAF